MEYLAGWRAVIWSAASCCCDLVWRCCRVTLSPTADDSTACVTSAFPIYIFPTSNTGSRKYYLWEKNDWLKNRLFFIIENFLGIWNRLCAEPMRRSHDFLSLTLAVVGLTSGRCYFLQQCRCLCFVCFSSSACEESSGSIKRDLLYFTLTELTNEVKTLNVELEVIVTGRRQCGKAWKKSFIWIIWEDTVKFDWKVEIMF